MISEENVRRFCCEDPSLIENYEEAVSSPERYDCHHRREIADGVVTSMKDLKKQGLYWHRPAEELIFLKRSEHQRLHTKGKPLSEEHRRKLSASKKEYECSEETRKKIAAAHRGKPSGAKGKPGPNKGKHWEKVNGKRVYY